MNCDSIFVGEAIRSDSPLLIAVHGVEMILCEADTYIGLGQGSPRDSGLSIVSTDGSPVGPSVT